MKKEFLNPKPLYEPRFFTHAVSIEEGAKLVYVSGQVSYDRDGIVVGEGSMREQCEQVFKSLGHALRAAGVGWSDVVKVNAYMVDMNMASVNVYREVRSRYFDKDRLPASTLVGVQRLVHEDLLLEVELIAVTRGKAKPAPAQKARNSKKRR